MGKDKNQQAAAEEAAAQAAEGVDAHPQLLEHGSFAHLPLGRVAARHDPRTLKLAKYLDDAVVLPEIPETFDLVPPVASWPMYGNDSLGDCTIATVGHMIQAWYAATGQTVTPDEAAIIAAYWETGSGDTGRFEVEVLNYWRNVGIAGDRILAYAYVDPQNLDHVRAALYLFGGLYTGIALPQTAQGQQVWDVAGDPQAPGPAQAGSWGGHAVPYLPRWNGSTIPLVTWGHVLDETVAFHLAYCDELYAPISPDFLTEGKTPAGFDVDALQADLAEITKQAEAVPLGDFIEHGAYVDAEGVTQVGTPPWADGGEQAAPSGVVEAIAPDLDDGYYWKG